MMLKQLFLDIIISISIPVLAVGVYFMWFRVDSGPMLSAKSEMLRTDPNEPGSQTKIVLESLNRITLNGSLFTSPTYLGLRVYTVDIPSEELAREFPFTPPATIREMLRRTNTNLRSTVAEPARSETISQQLDSLRMNMTR